MQNTSNVKVAIIQLSDDRRLTTTKTKLFPSHFMSQHARNLSIRVFIECPRPEFGNTFQEETPRRLQKQMSQRLQLDIFSAFYVLSYTS